MAHNNLTTVPGIFAWDLILTRCAGTIPGMKRTAILFSLPILLAQATPSTRDLEKEIAALRAENARLRAELEKTRSATAPATQARAFTTMQDILVNTPAELKPQANAEWYKYTGAKFDAWFEAQLVGMTFDQTLSFESADVTKSRGSGTVWNVFPIYFSSKSFNYFGEAHTWRVSVPTVQVDEAGAKKWDATKKGTLFRVKGSIASVEFSPDANGSDHTKLPSYHVVLRLRDVEFLSPNGK